MAVAQLVSRLGLSIFHCLSSRFLLDDQAAKARKFTRTVLVLVFPAGSDDWEELVNWWCRRNGCKKTEGLRGGIPATDIPVEQAT